MNKKLPIQFAVGLIVLVALIIGGAFYFINTKTETNKNIRRGLGDIRLSQEEYNKYLKKEAVENKNEKVGFIGCSLTHNAVNGYIALGGENFWIFDGPNSNFGGGCVSVWNNQLSNDPGDEKDYWGLFENLILENPDTEKIWWETCGCADAEDMSYGDFVSVLDNIKKIAPNMDIYVSPSPLYNYDDPNICASGLTGIARNVGRMVNANKVLLGPILSPLSGFETRDACHANEEGQAIWGQDLIDFFDN